MAWLQAKRVFDPAYAALGVIDPEVRIATFYWAVERLVVPRLTKLGLDGAEAWANRYRGGDVGAPGPLAIAGGVGGRAREDSNL